MIRRARFTSTRARSLPSPFQLSQCPDSARQRSYATARVAKVIRDWDGAKEKQWKPVFGAYPTAGNDFMIVLGAYMVAAELETRRRQ